VARLKQSSLRSSAGDLPVTLQAPMRDGGKLPSRAPSSFLFPACGSAGCVLGASVPPPADTDDVLTSCRVVKRQS